MDRKPKRTSRVPVGRLERVARIGWMSGGIALGSAAESVRRALAGADVDASVFLNPAGAERLARQLSKMRGAAMKVGQMLSMLDEQLVPPEFAEALAILRQSADAMPESQVRNTLAHEYGSDWPRLFEHFDFEPIAAASIGQVHTATARDGRELALKIQYPGVADSIESDVDNLATALRAARLLPGDLDLDPIAEEAKRVLRQEADYEEEAALLRRYRALVAHDERFVVPHGVDELTTPHILAMERLTGLPLEDLAGPDHPQERRDRVGALLMELTFRELYEFRLMQTDPNFSNYLLVDGGDTIGLLDFGSTCEVAPDVAARIGALLRALRNHAHDDLVQACIGLGYLREDDPESLIAPFVELLKLVYEPLVTEGPYDFAGAMSLQRGQELGFELVLKHGYLRTPPAELMFLQRKIDGMRLVCARIRARFDLGLVLDPFLAADSA